MECRLITNTGRVIDPTGPMNGLKLQDIAWSLAHTYRWAGMANPAVTVCQHSMAMARHYVDMFELLQDLDDLGRALLSLLHDAGEGLWRDIPYRIKYQEGMSWYREQEKACAARIIQLWAPEVADLDVKAADNGALLREMMDRFPDTPDKREWLANETENRPGIPLEAKYYKPTDDAIAWLRMYSELKIRYATEDVKRYGTKAEQRRRVGTVVGIEGTNVVVETGKSSEPAYTEALKRSDAEILRYCPDIVKAAEDRPTVPEVVRSEDEWHEMVEREALDYPEDRFVGGLPKDNTGCDI